MPRKSKTKTRLVVTLPVEWDGSWLVYKHNQETAVGYVSGSEEDGFYPYDCVREKTITGVFRSIPLARRAVERALGVRRVPAKRGKE